MTKRERQHLIGLEILKPDDPTLWKRALKSKRARHTDERKLIFGRDTKPGFVTMILERLKRPRE
jgi:hypothetical protein